MKVWIKGRILEVDRIVISKREFEEAIEDLPKGSTILWDEVSPRADARRQAMLHEARRRVLQDALDDALERLRHLPESE